MNNRIFLGLVLFAAAVLIGWFYFKGRAVFPATVNKTVQGTPTPAGSNLGPPENITGSTGNGLEKGGVPSK